MIPLYLDEVEVAFLLIYPTSARSVWQRIKVPVSFKEAASLVAVLLPWKMGPSAYSASGIDISFEKFSECEKLDDHVMGFLQFPSDLRLFMLRSSRQFCVWSPSGDSRNATHGLETKELLRILKKCKATNVGYKADVRVVFVHIAALKSFHQLHCLAERRMRSFDIRFWTYGTHPTVPKTQWGVQEIYPLGAPTAFWLPRIELTSWHRWRHDLHPRGSLRKPFRRCQINATGRRASYLGLLFTTICCRHGS